MGKQKLESHPTIVGWLLQIKKKLESYPLGYLKVLVRGGSVPANITKEALIDKIRNDSRDGLRYANALWTYDLLFEWYNHPPTSFSFKQIPIGIEPKDVKALEEHAATMPTKGRRPLPKKPELLARAKALGVKGASGMNTQGLYEGIYTAMERESKKSPSKKSNKTKTTRERSSKDGASTARKKSAPKKESRATLVEKAKKNGIKGYSKMNMDQLKEALGSPVRKTTGTGAPKKKPAKKGLEIKTLVELRKMAKDAGIPYSGKLSKAQVIEALLDRSVKKGKLEFNWRVHPWTKGHGKNTPFNPKMWKTVSAEKNKELERKFKIFQKDTSHTFRPLKDGYRVDFKAMTLTKTLKSGEERVYSITRALK